MPFFFRRKHASLALALLVILVLFAQVQAAAPAALSGPAAVTATGDVIAYDLVNSLSQNLTSYANVSEGGALGAGDGFEIYSRTEGGNIPFNCLDDSLSIFTNDNFGIIKDGNVDTFFCGVDLDVELTATWTFDISGSSDPYLYIDMAAMGDFEASGDFFTWSYAIDGASAATAFTSAVDEASSYTYVLEGGSGFTFDDPLVVDNIQLTNNFFTFFTQLGGSGGSQLVLTLTANSNAADEAFVFQNIKIVEGRLPDSQPPNLLSLDPADDGVADPLSTDLTLSFDEPVQAGSGNITLHRASDDAVIEAISVNSGQVTVNNYEVTVNPAADLTAGVDYYVIVDAGAIEDTYTTPNAYAGFNDKTTWNFLGNPLLTGGVCDDAATNIALIQGSGASSLFTGSSATIEGIVVGDYQNGSGVDGDLDGFFVQEEDSDADGNGATSDGIFVFEGTSPAADYAVGDRVRVTGTISEFADLTQLASPSVIVCSSGNGLPTATAIALPLSSGEAFEAYEGMRVQFTDTLVVTELFQLGRFGSLRLSTGGAGPDGRLAQYTQLNAPSVAGYSAALAEQARRSILLDNGVVNTGFGENPDPIVSPPDPELTAANPVRGGDTITNLTGILMDWTASPVTSNNGYRVQPLDASGTAFASANPRPTAPPTVNITGTAHITVGVANVLNFFETIDNGTDDICGPGGNLECRGADSASELTRQRDKIVAGLTGINADILGVVEIENDTDNSALQNLVDAMNGVVGAGTYDFIATGPIGSDAIRVGILYKPAVVTPVGSFAVLDSSVDATYRDGFNRPTLAQTFEVTDGSNPDVGARLTVAVVHLKSKGSSCNSVSDPDTGDGQGNCNLTRLAAATAIKNWLAGDPTGSESDHFMLVGDFNAYYREDPLTYLTINGYRSVFGADSYSYVFDGQWGSLDHALVSEALVAQVTGAAKWHVNADEPSVLDYNEEFKSAGQLVSLYAADAYRFSDHDPIVIGLDLRLEFELYLPLISSTP